MTTASAGLLLQLSVVATLFLALELLLHPFGKGEARVPLLGVVDPGVARKQKTLRAFNVAAAITGSVLVLLGRTSPVFSVLLALLPLLTALAVAALRPLPNAGASARFSVPLDRPPGLLSLMSWPLQFASLTLVLAAIAGFAALLPTLPDQVPLHVGASGVDRWGAPQQLWALAGVFLLGLALPWIAGALVSAERWALPVDAPARGALLQFKRRSLIVRLIEAIALVINVLSAALLFGFVAIARAPNASGLLVIVAVLSGPTILIFVACFVGPLSAVERELRELGKTEALGTRSDGWRWGGLIYFAPEDPALIVPKRVGVGQTLNFGQGRAWLVGSGLVLLLLALALLPYACASR